MTRDPRPIDVLVAERPDLQLASRVMRDATSAEPKLASGRRRYGGVHAIYPKADDVVDAGLVGRAELIELTGLEPQAGRKWYATWIAAGRFPPADGQVIDRRPTWRRRTIVPFLYLAARANGERYLAEPYWAEAEALLDEQELRGGN